jgi:hypothetical protein
MKRIAVILAILIALPIVTYAGDNDLKKLFTKYKSESGFELEIGDPDIDFDFDGDWSFGDFLNDIENFYILQFDSEKGNLKSLQSFKTKLEKLIDKKSFETLIDIGGEGKVQILSRKNSAGKTSDYLIITEDEDDATIIWASSN